MTKWFWLFAPLFIFLALLPNYCFASTISGLKIEEIKTRGLNISSTAAKWLEIANVSDVSINLDNVCLASGLDKISTTEPKNCFPINTILNSLQTVIVAYSGNAFLQDNNLTLAGLSNPFFELGGYGASFADDPGIPNLISPYKTSFLNIGSGQIILYDKTDGSVIDQVSWSDDQGTINSIQRPVYDDNFDFVNASPTPFKLLPEFSAISSVKIKTDSAQFSISRINDPNKIIQETASLWQNGNQIQEQDGSLNSITFKGLTAGTNYELRFSGCEIATGFCFSTSQNFTTKQNYLSLLINEIYPAPDTSSGETEWLELYNPNSIVLDLSGWQVKDRSGHIFDLSGLVLPNNYLVFYPGSKLSLNNDGDDLLLFDPNGDNRDQTTYSKALDQFSYSRFTDGFLWSRKNTPNSKNILVPQYLPQKIKQIKNKEEQVQIQGQVIMAPGDFAKSYFYASDASFALKIESNDKLNLAHNQCFLAFGKIKAGREKYLDLDNLTLLNNCDLIAPAVFVDPDNASLDSLIGRLIKLNGEIYTSGSSYFIDYQGQKIKIRGTFKLYKGTGEIKGILGFGTSYYQLFLINQSWFQVTPKVNSPPVINLDSADETDAILASAPKINVKGVSYQTLSDYRSSPNNKQPNYYFLIFYYLSTLIFFVLAKILVFG